MVERFIWVELVTSEHAYHVTEVYIVLLDVINDTILSLDDASGVQYANQAEVFQSDPAYASRSCLLVTIIFLKHSPMTVSISIRYRRRYMYMLLFFGDGFWVA